jgi:hypothetical protein
LFLSWFYRAYRNLESLGATNLRFTPGWAVGWFFIPFWNLIRPIQIAGEIWRWSVPGADAGGQRSSRAIPGIVVGWWIPYAISRIAAFIARRTTVGGEDAMSSVAGKSFWMLGADVLTIPAAVFAIIMMRKILAGQMERHERVRGSQRPEPEDDGAREVEERDG